MNDVDLPSIEQQSVATPLFVEEWMCFIENLFLIFSKKEIKKDFS